MTLCFRLHIKNQNHSFTFFKCKVLFVDFKCFWIIDLMFDFFHNHYSKAWWFGEICLTNWLCILYNQIYCALLFSDYRTFCVLSNKAKELKTKLKFGLRKAIIVIKLFLQPFSGENVISTYVQPTVPTTCVITLVCS